MSDVPADGRQLVLRTLRRHKRRVVLSSALLVGHQGCEALVPLVIGVTIDRAVATGDTTALAYCIAALIGLFTLLSLCWRAGYLLGEGASAHEAHDLRVELSDRLLDRRGLETDRHRGELLSVATSDADAAAEGVTSVRGFAGVVAALGVSAAVLVGIDLRLGLELIVAALLVTAGIGALSPLITRRAMAQQQSVAESTALATDLVSGLRALRGIGASAHASARYRVVSERAVAAGIDAGTVKAVQTGLTTFASTVLLAVSVLLAGYLTLEGDISIGAFITAVGVAQFIAEPITGLGYYISLAATTKGSAERVADVLHTPHRVPEGELRQSFAAGAPVVELAGEFDLRVAPGEYVGVVCADPGESNALVDALAGSARVDGRPARDYTLESLRAAVHVEPHRPDLFAGSIGDNLRAGRSDDGTVGAGRIDSAVEAASAGEILETLPDGSEQQVLDRGLNLSGGQRQRLALARALSTDAPVLVLHDPTTAVDSVTEESIAAGIRALRHAGGPPRTTIVVTSSPVLLGTADRVVHVRDRRVVAEGTHDTLLAADADYRAEVLR